MINSCDFYDNFFYRGKCFFGYRCSLTDSAKTIIQLNIGKSSIPDMITNSFVNYFYVVQLQRGRIFCGFYCKFGYCFEPYDLTSRPYNASHIKSV